MNPTTRSAFVCLWTMLLPVAAQTVPEPSPVPQLCEMLASPDAAIRLAAAERLASVSPGVMGLPAQAAVPALLRVFANDADSDTAEMAALALAAIGTWQLGALDHVAAQLDAWERAGAENPVIERIRAATRQPDHAWPGVAIVPDLVAVLRVRACAPGVLGALALLGSDAASAAPAIAALLAESGEDGIRWRAAFALAQMGATEPLRAGLADQHAAVRLWSMRALHAAATPQAAPDAALVAAVLPLLDDDRPLVVGWAIRTVATFGNAAAPAVPKLVAMLEAPPTVAGVQASWAAHAALIELGPAAVAAVPILVERLAKEDVQPHLSVAHILAAIGPAAAAAIEPLFLLATARPSTDPIQADLDKNRAMVAIGALARIDAARVVATLLPGVEQKPEHDDPGSWYHVWQLSDLGPAAATAVPRLRRMLASTDQRAKARALLVLARIGEPAVAEALPDIVAALAIDGDDYLRYVALQAIFAIGPAAASAMPALEAAFARAGDRRIEVIRQLHKLGDGAEPLLVRATTDSEHWTRSIAAEQILLLPEASPRALAAVVTLLDDANGIVRSEVLQDLLSSRKHASLAREQVLRLLRSEDAQLRDLCVNAQWESFARKIDWDPVGDGWYGVGFDTLKYAWGMRERKPAEMEVFGEASRLTAWALAFATDHRAEIRAAAATVLGQLPSTKASLEALATLAVAKESGVRRAAVTAIGRHGSAARAHAGVLAKAWHDGEWFVRAAASKALRAVHAK